MVYHELIDSTASHSFLSSHRVNQPTRPPPNNAGFINPQIPRKASIYGSFEGNLAPIPRSFSRATLALFDCRTWTTETLFTERGNASGLCTSVNGASSVGARHEALRAPAFQVLSRKISTPWWGVLVGFWSSKLSGHSKVTLTFRSSGHPKTTLLFKSSWIYNP